MIESQLLFGKPHKWCARRESNPRFQLRRLTSYPLDYERNFQAGIIIARIGLLVQSWQKHNQEIQKPRAYCSSFCAKS